MSASPKKKPARGAAGPAAKRQKRAPRPSRPVTQRLSSAPSPPGSVSSGEMARHRAANGRMGPLPPRLPSLRGMQAERKPSSPEEQLLRLDDQRVAADQPAPELRPDSSVEEVQAALAADARRAGENAATRTGLTEHLARLPSASLLLNRDDEGRWLEAAVSHPAYATHDLSVRDCEWLLAEAGMFVDAETGVSVEWPVCMHGERCAHVKVDALPGYRAQQHGKRRPLVALLGRDEIRELRHSGQAPKRRAPCLLCTMYHFTCAHALLCARGRGIHTEGEVTLQPVAMKSGGEDGFYSSALIKPAADSLGVCARPFLPFRSSYMFLREDERVRAPPHGWPAGRPRLRLDLSAVATPPGFDEAPDGGGRSVLSGGAARTIQQNLQDLERYFWMGDTARANSDALKAPLPTAVHEAQLRAAVATVSPDLYDQPEALARVAQDASLDRFTRYGAWLLYDEAMRVSPDASAAAAACYYVAPWTLGFLDEHPPRPFFPHAKECSGGASLGYVDREAKCRKGARRRRRQGRRTVYEKRQDQVAGETRRLTDVETLLRKLLQKTMPRPAITRSFEAIARTSVQKLRQDEPGREALAFLGRVLMATMMGSYPHLAPDLSEARTTLGRRLRRYAPMEVALLVAEHCIVFFIYALRQYALHLVRDTPPLEYVLAESWSGGPPAYHAYTDFVDRVAAEMRGVLQAVKVPRGAGAGLEVVLQQAAGELAERYAVHQNDSMRMHSFTVCSTRLSELSRGLRHEDVPTAKALRKEALALAEEGAGEYEALQHLSKMLHDRGLLRTETLSRLMACGLAAIKWVSRDERDALNLLARVYCDAAHVSMVELPESYRRHQLEALADEHGRVDPHLCEIAYCTVCFGVRTPRRLGGSRAFGLVNSMMGEDGRLTCYRKDHEALCSADGRYCVTTPLSYVPLVGAAMRIGHTTYLLCPQKGCGDLMAYDPARCEWNERGVACENCTPRLRMEHAFDHSPLLHRVAAKSMESYASCDTCTSELQGLSAYVQTLARGQPTDRLGHRVYVYPHQTLICDSCHTEAMPSRLPDCATREEMQAAIREDIRMRRGGYRRRK